MSTPINADDIICIEYKTLWSQKSEEHTIDSSSPPPPQTAPTSEITNDNEGQTGCPQQLPYHLNVIKEFIKTIKNMTTSR